MRESNQDPCLGQSRCGLVGDPLAPGVITCVLRILKDPDASKCLGIIVLG